MDPTIVVRPAVAKQDLDQVLALLRGASLPTEGVEEHFSDFLVAVEPAGKVVGTIGMERYPDRAGLLRSAVVQASLRNSGIGSSLYKELIERTRLSGIRRVILLTNTAEAYFAGKGFRKIDRSSVTGPITGSTEFTGACPASAVCMELFLAPRILVLCTGNSCRSQMAEAILRAMDPGLEVFSAGTSPAKEVHPNAVLVMKEIGLDLSAAVPKSVDQFLSTSFDFVVTVCDHARQACPLFTGRVGRRVHLGFEDPAEARGNPGEILAAFRRTRDMILTAFRAFYAEELG